MPNITPLSKPTSTTLRSALVIPTFAQIVSELVQNSLDAEATRIDIWLDLSRGAESIRIEDDGKGIPVKDLDEIGRRYRTNKTRSNHDIGPLGMYGFRGEALSSIAALSQVEITTRTSRASETHTKIIKSSKIIFSGPHHSRAHHISGPHGTTVLVKEIFNNIPVRRHEINGASSASTFAACRSAVEKLALVRPGVKWGLWEIKDGDAAGRSERKVLSLSGMRSSLEVFRVLYGNALVHRVQKIRVSSENRRVDGFISLSGDVTKSHQHLYVNGYPLDRGELHLAIGKRFAKSRFASAASSGAHDELDDYVPNGRLSPRRLERSPIYVLNVALPAEDIDVAYDPRKGVLGYTDFDAVKALLLAVVEEYLKRNGYATTYTSPEKTITPSPVRTSRTAPYTPKTPSRLAVVTTSSTPRKPPGRTVVLSEPNPFWVGPPQQVVGPESQRQGMVPLTPASDASPPRQIAGATTVDSQQLQTPSLDQIVSHFPSCNEPSSCPPSKRRRLDSPPDQWLFKARNINERGFRNHQWISDLVDESNAALFPLPEADRRRPSFLDESESVGRDHSPDSHSSVRSCACQNAQSSSSKPAERHPTLPVPAKVETRITRHALGNAKIMGQVDRKYIAILVPTELPKISGRITPLSSSPSNTVILVDQHAADERISVELILSELCSGFLQDNVPTTALETKPLLLLTRAEAELLACPGVGEIMKRWGILLVPPQPAKDVDGDYAQVELEAVPTALLSRLGRKEGSEMTRLIRLYLPFLREIQGELEAMLRRYGAAFDSTGLEVNEKLSNVQHARQNDGNHESCNHHVQGDESTGYANDDNGKHALDIQETNDHQDSLNSESNGKHEESEHTWDQAIRFIPKEMLDLANSKACRGAIMFEDRLTHDQCTRLVQQLAKTKFPFMCAHGRPSMVPLLVLASVRHDTADNDGGIGRRRIDWKGWGRGTQAFQDTNASGK